MTWFMGIDIGSGTSKGVIIKDGELSVYHLLPSGINYRVAALKLREELLAKGEVLPEEIAGVTATGRGAVSVPFSDHEVPDIRCCARGIKSIFPTVRTVVDVQGMSTQIILLGEEGQVINFAISEKCAAGSGRFLDIIANVLRIDLKDIGPLSLKSKNPVVFTTGCAVFGESEAITRVSEGAAKEDIVAGVHKALANKISALVDRVGLEKDCAISGGGALDCGLVKSVEAELGIQLLIPPLPQFINALGAAIMAEERNGREITQQ
jgi:predicted CoA-substrate-specific enzyme activase